ncbi:hypothetical protein H7B90_21130 [Cohnella xylanilytica]|uniref:Uncharacterized protein n=1 Tax=Cohnella xylanilytica TaxID=557555 RepID=A0A841U056_9BACL|nr:hypothetical protein [Cohnella xylanilytica]MBB6693906.1 hypothetical protein [Cohnella xylanilytica]
MADPTRRRESRYRLNAAPLKEIEDGASHYRKYWTDRFALLNRLAEEEI